MNSLTNNFIKKETLAQVFSCESFEISKNTFLHRTPSVAASDISLLICDKESGKCRWKKVFQFSQK